VSVIETDRLALRPWVADDIDALAAIFAVPAVWHYPLGRGLTREESENFLDRQMHHWEEHGFCMWAAEVKDEKRLAGFVGLAVPTWLPEVLPAVEVGWRLHPDHWGQGLATEGGSATLRYGFEHLRLDRIISILMPENAASGRVMAKLGLQHRLETEDPRRGMVLHVREITASSWRATLARADPGPEGGAG